MRYSKRLFVSCLMSLLSLLAHTFLCAEPQNIKETDLEETMGVDDPKFSSHLLRGKRGHRSNSSSLILYKADLSQCRVGIDVDRSLIGYTVDFVTDLDGDDFACSPLSKRGIQVTPRNGVSFTKTIPPIGELGPSIRGHIDHTKFLAYSVFAEAPLNDGELCTTWVASGQQTNVANHPFGSAVVNPNEDLRLASYGLVSLDPASEIILDWFCTNDIIYVYVARIPGAEALFGEYAAYVYGIPVAKRHPNKEPLEDIRTFQLCYNRKKGEVTWKLDGHSVLTITQLGHRLTPENTFIYKHGERRPLRDPNRFKLIDNGGVEQDIRPIGFQTGIGLFTLLDGYLPNNQAGIPNQGLVRLDSLGFRAGRPYYNNPLAPLGTPAQFVVDNRSFDPLTGFYSPLTIPSSFRVFGPGSFD